MRLYRARKNNVTCYNQMIVAIVGTLTVVIRKYKNKRCYHVNYSYYHLIVASYIFNVNFNANLKLFLRLSNCASVGEKNLIIVKMHGVYVRKDNN
jgi:CRISPR/Cas system-associated endoribonuclease Cas2